MFTFCFLCGIVAVGIIVGNDYYNEWQEKKRNARFEARQMGRNTYQGRSNPRVDAMNSLWNTRRDK